MLASHIQLFVTPPTSSEVKRMLSASLIKYFVGVEGAYLHFIYSSELAGETLTAPHLRVCSLRAQYVHVCINGALEWRRENFSAHKGLTSSDVVTFFGRWEARELQYIQELVGSVHGRRSQRPAGQEDHYYV